MRRVLLATLVAALVWVPVAGAWSWPAGGVVLQHFSFDPAHPYAAGEHRGIDVGGTPGEAVLAPRSGTVTFAGTVPGSGKAVTIATDDGLSISLTHLGSIDVAEHATVDEGSPVGRIGPGGDGEHAEPYVHLGVRETAKDQGYLDPESFLPVRASSQAPPPPSTAPPAPPPAPPAQPASVPAASSPPPETAPAPGQAQPSAPPQPVSAVPVASAPAPAVPVATTTVAPAGDASAPDALTVVRPGSSRSSSPTARESGSASGTALTVLPRALGRARVLGSVAPRPSAHAAVTPPVRAAHRAAPAAAAAAVPARPAARRTTPAARSHHRHPRTTSPAAAPPLVTGHATVAHRATGARSPGTRLRAAPPLAIAHDRTPLVLLAAESATLLVALAAVLALILRARARKEDVHIIAGGVDGTTQDPGGAGLAVRGGAPSPWPYRRLRRPSRRVRALPPATRQRRADGERHGRARDADHGGRRSRGEVLR